MKKFLFFNIKEPYEKIIDKILDAKNDKNKIEFSDEYLRCILKNNEQKDKFVEWLDQNKEWIEPCLSMENGIDRYFKVFPPCYTISVNTPTLEQYFIFDFVE